MVRDHYRIRNIPKPGRAAHVLLKFVEVAFQQCKALTVVPLRTRKRKPVGGVVGKNKAEVISLNFLVTGTGRSQWSRVNLRKQTLMLVVGREGPEKLVFGCL